MRKEPDKNWLSATGRTKTVIITSGATAGPIGIVSEIVTHISSKPITDRIAFRGPAHFDSRSLSQLHSIILPLVDQITGHLNVPERNYEISVTTMGAAAAADRGMKISGFSADLPVFLAILSTSLNINIRQDIIGTGHIASIDGEIGPVKGIQAKLEAALDTPGVTGFVLPDMERDRSLRVLTPIEYESVMECLLQHKGAINIHPVKDIYDAIRIYLKDESIVFGSLKTGFFTVKPPDLDLHSSIGRTVRLFCEGIDKLFWDSLSNFLFNRDFEKAKRFLREFLNFHIRKQIYPENFGQNLLQLVISLPPRLRESKGLFPLFPMDLYIKVSQHAKEKDFVDSQGLYKATFWEKHSMQGAHLTTTQESQHSEDDTEHALFERILAEINKDNLSEKFGRPFDIGRATYIMDTITVKDGFEFNESISSFCAHMLRHANQSVDELKEGAITADAIDLANKAFEPKGGYKAALAEGKAGTNGGMRMVFDTMTEYLKQREMEKHISRIFKEMVDSLDWDAQVRLMEIFMEKIGPHLSEEIRGIPAKQLASQWDVIIRFYVESMEKVKNVIKRL